MARAISEEHLDQDAVLGNAEQLSRAARAVYACPDHGLKIVGYISVNQRNDYADTLVRRPSARICQPADSHSS